MNERDHIQDELDKKRRGRFWRWLKENQTKVLWAALILLSALSLANWLIKPKQPINGVIYQKVFKGPILAPQVDAPAIRVDEMVVNRAMVSKSYYTPDETRRNYDMGRGQRRLFRFLLKNGGITQGQYDSLFVRPPAPKPRPVPEVEEDPEEESDEEEALDEKE